MSDIEQRLEERYARSFGRIAGYLPKNRSAVDAFQRSLMQSLTAENELQSPSVAALARLIETDGVIRMYVTQMIQQVEPAHRNHIESIQALLMALDQIVRTAPKYNRDPARQNSFPVSSLFAYMMMTVAGEAAFRNAAFNSAIRDILQEWCKFLDSPASLYVLNEGDEGWLSQPAFEQNKLSEFVIPDRNAPHWGFASFNAYFHRLIKAKYRPISTPNNTKVIVSPNERSSPGKKMFRSARSSGSKANPTLCMTCCKGNLLNASRAARSSNRFSPERITIAGMPRSQAALPA